MGSGWYPWLLVGVIAALGVGMGVDMKSRTSGFCEFGCDLRIHHPANLMIIFSFLVCDVFLPVSLRLFASPWRVLPKSVLTIRGLPRQGRLLIPECISSQQSLNGKQTNTVYGRSPFNGPFIHWFSRFPNSGGVLLID